MRGLFLLCTFICIVALPANAQLSNMLVDTFSIDEISTVATYKKYQAGAKVEAIPEEQIEISQNAGLDKLLSRFTPIYIKSDASGLSSIRLRGTSADHTTVNYGGININSLTLGSSNFSNVPVYLFDNIDLQYGSSSAVNGTGAIGGAVYLGLSNNWTKGTRVKANISLGSFGHQLYGTKVYAGNGKFESVTRMYYFALENNFPFDYNGVEYKQENAAIEHYGLLQEFNYKFDAQQWLKTSVWIENDFHEQQWVKASHLTGTGGNPTTDESFLRSWSEYENQHGAINFKLGLGFVHDKMIDSDNDDQEIGTNRLIAEAEGKQDVSKNFGYKFGMKYRYIKPDVYSYANASIDYEQRADLYASAFYSAWNRLKLTLNLRQQFVTDFNAPFTPTLGADFRVLVTNHSLLKLNGNIASSYRIPTFNDRFWGDQGNPDLKPEDGINYELGLDYQYSADRFSSNFKLNAFYMDVDNWIEWRPGTGGEYYAENRARVVSKGLEFQSSANYTLSDNEFTLTINYTLNPTEVKEDELESRVGKSLIYTPKHNANIYFAYQYKTWMAFVSGTYTGERQVDYSGSYEHPDGSVLEGYALMDIGLRKDFKLFRQDFNLSATSYNLLNKSYENQMGYAMPGRSFMFSLSTDLNFTK